MTFGFQLILAALFGAVDIYCVCRLLNYSLTFRFPEKKLVPIFTGIYVLYVLMQILTGTFSSYPVKPALLLFCSILLFFLYSDAFYKKIFWIFFVMLILYHISPGERENFSGLLQRDIRHSFY